MPFVTILPNEKLCPQGAKIEVKTGEKLAQSLNKAGINLPHACEYNCACATCHVIVLDNAFGATSESRLACQTVMGDKDITIEIPKNNRNLVNE